MNEQSFLVYCVSDNFSLNAKANLTSPPFVYSVFISLFCQWVTFPSVNGGPYQAELTVREPSLPRLPTSVSSGPSWTSGGGEPRSNPLFDETCTMDVNIKMYCKINDPQFKECNVFFAYKPNQCKGHVDFCAQSTI